MIIPCDQNAGQNHNKKMGNKSSESVEQFRYADQPYLLTPWSRFLLEKLTGLQLVKKFPAFYGTRRFLTALTSVCHLSLSWASPIQSTYPHPTSWRSILILSTHLCLGLPSGLFPSSFPTKTLYAPLSYPYVPHGRPTLTNQNSIHEEIKSRFCYHLVQNFWSSSVLSTSIAIKIHRTVILPVVLYGCEGGT